MGKRQRKANKQLERMVMTMAREAGQARRLLAEYVECWDQENATPPLRTWQWAFEWRKRVKAFLNEDSKED